MAARPRTTWGVAISAATPTTRLAAMYPTFHQPSMGWLSPKLLGTAQPHKGNVVPPNATAHIVTTIVKFMIPRGNLITP